MVPPCYKAGISQFLVKVLEFQKFFGYFEKLRRLKYLLDHSDFF